MWAIRLGKRLTRLINGLIPNYYEGELSGEILLDGGNVSGFPSMKQQYVGVFSKSRTQFFTVDSTSNWPLDVKIRGCLKKSFSG
ncbi:MAG: hypothetical protein ACLRJV_20650 [Eubacteriales bacterium]